MMVQTRRRKTREFTGPAPHSVAILARPPNKIPPEHLILERRKKDDARRQAVEMTEYNKLFDLKNDWERSTDKRIQLNTVKRKVTTMLKANEYSLEDRRERLRQVLLAEEQMYLEEMAASEETVLERQAKMREKARALKDRREAERQELVQEKLKQQWHDQCEELRGTLSKRQQDLVAAERMEQLREKDQLQRAREEEERMYADLWYADMAAKAQREEEDTRRQMQANMETLSVLQKQKAALEAKKQEEKALIEEEARLMKEQAMLRKIEEQKALEEKRQRQMEIAAMYNKSLRLKREKEARELQEQLAFDMKILEQLLEESRNEAMEQAQRKRELREEDKRYRDYLAKMKIEEAQRERELERLCDAEVEKTWEKKVRQWKLEKEARRKLLEEVMASRRMQLQEKLRENMQRQAEAASERETLIRKIEENKKIEAEQMERTHRKNLRYQDDLLGQISYNRQMQAVDQEEKELMWRAEQEAEKEYRAKLEEALNNPVLPNMHPLRKRASAHQIAPARGGGLNI